MLLDVLFTHDINSPDENGTIWITNIKLTLISTKETFNIECSTNKGMLYLCTYDEIFHAIYNVLYELKDSLYFYKTPTSKNHKKNNDLWLSSLSICDVDGRSISASNYYKISNFKTEYFVRTYDNKAGIPLFYTKYASIQIPRYFYNKYSNDLISEEKLVTLSLQRITAYVIRTANIHMKNMVDYSQTDDANSDDSTKELVNSELNFSDVNISDMFKYDISEYASITSEAKKPTRIASMPNIKILDAIPEDSISEDLIQEETESNTDNIIHKIMDDSIIDNNFKDEVTL
jgi:hypothetical protein